MSNVLSFPPGQPMEVIDEAYFERFTDPALLLKCFEVLDGALEVICDPELSIEIEDDTHVELIEALWAIKVLFKRKTGHDAERVSQDHWEIASECLLAGEELPDMRIPIADAFIQPTPPEQYEQLTNLELACSAFNSSDKVRLGTNATLSAGNARISATVAVEAINATTALRSLVLRLSGGSMQSFSDLVSRKPGETLQ